MLIKIKEVWDVIHRLRAYDVTADHIVGIYATHAGIAWLSRVNGHYVNLGMTPDYVLDYCPELDSRKTGVVCISIDKFIAEYQEMVHIFRRGDSLVELLTYAIPMATADYKIPGKSLCHKLPINL